MILVSTVSLLLLILCFAKCDSIAETDTTTTSSLTEVYTQSYSSWPFAINNNRNDRNASRLPFGQVTAVDVTDDNNIIIFHRGDHVWNDKTFDSRNNYQQRDSGPITTDTIVVINPYSKQIVKSWGSDLFYLPHGLSLVGNATIWLTDVALHQVFKFTLDATQQPKQPSLVLGEKFVPGDDGSHFCKPTSAAVTANGDIYVADGYCNSRVIRFDRNGKFLNQWGHNDRMGYFLDPPINSFNIPHKIILIEERQLACIADREHGRVECFAIPYGDFHFQISHEEFNGRLFSISYSHSRALLYAVCGPSLFQSKNVLGFIFNITDRRMVGVFAPNSGTFTQPHDIAVSKDGNNIFVVEIGPNNVWMFSRTKHDLTQSNDDNANPILSKLDNNHKKKSGVNILSYHTPIEIDSDTSANNQNYYNTYDKNTSQPQQQQQHELIDAYSPPVTAKIVSNSGDETNVKRAESHSVADQSTTTSSLLSSKTAMMLSLLAIAFILVIIISMAISLRRSGHNGVCLRKTFKRFLGGGYECRDSKSQSRTQQKYDIGRLIGRHSDKHNKTGFNRVPIEESDGDIDKDDDDSDSEVEEFNISSATTSLTVPSKA